MGGKKQQAFETDAPHFAEIQDALDQFVQAQDYAHHVLRNAGLLPTGTKNVGTAAHGSTNGDFTTRSVAIIPHWDSATRELRLGRRVVKQYRVPSSTQEVILEAFQEEGWPPHLDNPLPSILDGYPPDRLRDAIRNLNSSQKNRLIRFRGDGNGQGILWELIDGHARNRCRR